MIFCHCLLIRAPINIIEYFNFSSLGLPSSNMNGNCSITILIFACTAVFASSAFPRDVQESADAVCPRIVSRVEWKARQARSSQALPYSPAPYLVVHHGGIKRYCRDQESCSAIVRSYQNLHLDERGWADIGYNFLIGEDGNVYQGRGWDRVGAHAPGYNFQSIGVCFLGDFTDSLPNEAALKALNSLVRCGLALNKLKKDYLVIGHRQARDTECPGEALYKYVQSFPNWTDNPMPMLSNSTLATVH